MKEFQNQMYTTVDGRSIELRLIGPHDSVEELTSLLNKSYQTLADMGLNYLAASQDHHVTRRRINKAYMCIIGICSGEIVSTISLYKNSPSQDSKWYSNPFVAKVGQFAVLPEFRKFGLGSMMMDMVEREARKLSGIQELALDTAETADHLVKFYKARAYRIKETVSWDITNYRSFVMSKSLDGSE